MKKFIKNKTYKTRLLTHTVYYFENDCYLSIEELINSNLNLKKIPIPKDKIKEFNSKKFITVNNAMITTAWLGISEKYRNYTLEKITSLNRSLLQLSILLDEKKNPSCTETPEPYKKLFPKNKFGHNCFDLIG